MQKESCKIYERYSNTPGEVTKNIFYYPEWAGRFVCKSDFYIDRCGYQSILILCTESGCGKLCYRGKEYILSQNSFALINCADHHVYFPIGDSDWTFKFVHFSGGNSVPFYEHIFSIGECVFSYKKCVFDAISECILLCRDKPSTYEIQASKIIGDILFEALQLSVISEKDRITLVCEYIAQNYNKRLTTEALAEIACFSRCYFSTVFKKVTGKALHDYLLCYRLDKAKELLMNSDHSIAVISEITGFCDTGTFIRAFKKKEKTTPLQYKKLNK